jgi:hypothetical protein
MHDTKRLEDDVSWARCCKYIPAETTHQISQKVVVDIFGALIDRLCDSWKSERVFLSQAPQCRQGFVQLSAIMITISEID